jgi:predicted HTH transcriptional regulator
VIPANLAQWNFDTIKDLVDRGYLESDEFDFKLAMKNLNPVIDNKIIETSCAFANTDGGFIIFGVKDMDKNTDDRIVGH